MADYRIYCIDRDGRIGFAQWLEAGCDEDALQEAKVLRPDAQRCEVWNHGRLIATLESGTLNGDAAST